MLNLLTQFLDGLLLAKTLSHYNFTHRWKLKNSHSLFSCKDVFSFIDKDLMQPATNIRKKYRCLHITAWGYSSVLRTVLTTHSVSLESPALPVSPFREFCLLTIKWLTFLNISIFLFSSPRKVQCTVLINFNTAINPYRKLHLLPVFKCICFHWWHSFSCYGLQSSNSTVT